MSKHENLRSVNGRKDGWVDGRTDGCRPCRYVGYVGIHVAEYMGQQIKESQLGSWLPSWEILCMCIYR